jgi:DNA-binding NarL/FixJ family response regulator
MALSSAGSPNAGPLRIVLVDDHEMVVAGLKAMLAPFRARVLVVGEAIGADEALGVVFGLDPDIVLCDVRMQGASGLDLCRTLRERDPRRKVVLLSVYDDEQYLFQALRAGASGYLLKKISSEDLVRQLELAHSGVTVIDAALAGRAVDTAARLQSNEFWPGARHGLTHRESEVLSLIVAGLSNRAIAGRLVVSDETVKSHLRSIYRKLEVNDRTGAVATRYRAARPGGLPPGARAGRAGAGERAAAGHHRGGVQRSRGGADGRRRGPVDHRRDHHRRVLRACAGRHRALAHPGRCDPAVRPAGRPHPAALRLRGDRLGGQPP